VTGDQDRSLDQLSAKKHPPTNKGRRVILLDST
jgi:hypothetical protein